MSGLVCLQGGAEFGSACADMDSEVLGRAPDGAVVVLPAAASPGAEYRIAGANATEYYGRISGRAVRVAPDPRTDADACGATVEGAALLVLPGGSPRRLLDALRGPVGSAVRRLHRRGGAVSGASAGAMVLAELTAVPGTGVEPGLGLVEGLVVPHFDGSNWWHLDVPDGVVRWGLPECGGVLFDGSRMEAVGAPGTARRGPDGSVDLLS